MALDRLQLDDALSPFKKDYANNVFVWGKENDEHLILDTIVINSRKVEVPFTKEIISNLIKEFKTTNTECASKVDEAYFKPGFQCEVRAEVMHIPHYDTLKESLKRSAVKAIREQFELGLEVFSNADVDVAVKSMVICEPNGIHKESFRGKTHNKIFGTLLLHLPVESDLFVGAKVMTIFQGRTQSYEYKSKSPFNLTFMVGNRNSTRDYGEVTIQAFNGSHPIAVLVFNIVWLDPHGLTRIFHPEIFPHLLKKIQNASEALDGWKEIPTEKENFQTPKKTHFLDSRSSTEIPPLRTPLTRALCIPARHSYFYLDFNMDNLKPNDVLTAHILKAVPFIDVNLVTLKIDYRRESAESMVLDSGIIKKLMTGREKQKPMTIDETYDEKEDNNIITTHGSCEENLLFTNSRDSGSSSTLVQQESGNTEIANLFIDWKKSAIDGDCAIFSLHQWVGGGWPHPNSQNNFSHLFADRHLVGDVATTIEDEPIGVGPGQEAPRKRTRIEISTPLNFMYHPAFIIRPRQAAIVECWDNSPVYAVQCLTYQFNYQQNQNAHESESSRRCMLRDANFIVDLVVKKGGKLNECQRTAILRQLLYICTRLKATDEALRIMELISKRECECRKAHKDGFVGFAEESTRMSKEDVIVTLVSLAGWERCSSAVCAMFSQRKSEAYVNLYYLSYGFAHYGCIEAAALFAKLALEKLVEDVDGIYSLCVSSDDVLQYILMAEKADQQSRLEIYELLGKISTKDALPLGIMIERFFENLNDKTEKSEDLKLSITRIIGQVDVCNGRYAKEVVSVICFLEHTENPELSKKLWANLLYLPEDEEDNEWECNNPIFTLEHLLNKPLEWIQLRFVGILYKTIGTLPLARECFYKFIESGKPESKFAITLHHFAFLLSMAGPEPRLADEQKLNSFCSTFKELGLHDLVKFAEFVVKYNEDHHISPISRNICSALLDATSRSNPSILIREESDVFYKFMDCFIKLSSSASTLAVVNNLNESFNGNFKDPLAVALKTGKTDLCFNTWLVYLKEELEVNEQTDDSVTAYQILYFFKIYLETKNVNPLEAKAEDFGDVAKQLTFGFLERLLYALYDREDERAPTCLKDDYWRWKISQVLSDLVATHPEMKKEFSKSDSERIMDILCCIFWLGSKVANERFAHLVCTVPFPSMNECLSFEILSDDEVQYCAISSPFAFNALQKMVRYCIRRLFFEAGSSKSWARREVTLANYPEVEAFYHSNERSKSFGPFKTVTEAKSFGNATTKDFHWAYHVISKTGNSTSCEITKLYSTRLDSTCARSVPLMCQKLHASYNRVFSKKSRTEDISKFHKCLVCLTASLSSPQSPTNRRFLFLQ